MMKTFFMKCPNCKSVINVEDRDGILKCYNCNNLYEYHTKTKKLNLYKESMSNRGGLERQSCCNCGASIKIDTPWKSHNVVCEHCQSTLYWDAPLKEMFISLRQAEMAHEKYMLNRKYKQEDKRAQAKLNKKIAEAEAVKSNNRLIFLLFLLGFMMAAGFFLWGAYGDSIKDKKTITKLKNMENEIIAQIDMKDYDAALITINKMGILQNLSIENKKLWEEKQNNYNIIILNEKRESDLNNPDNILAPLNSNEFGKYTVDEAVSIFKNAGFINVNTQMIEGGGGLFKKKHLVEHVNFGGKNSFTSEDYINKSDRVTIYYYSK